MVEKSIRPIMAFPGITFRVTADETSLGPGTMTVLEKGILFEAKNHQHLGFDFDSVRLIRVRGPSSFDVAYSFQGSIRIASFATAPRYIRKNEGIEKDVTTDPRGWTMTFWKLHSITGAIVARVLADQSGAQTEGFAPVNDEEFESQIGHAGDLIERLPSQSEITSGNSTGEELEGLEKQLNEILLSLTDAWLLGNLSQGQREEVAALCYRDQLKRYELGWYHSLATELYSQMTNQDYKENADDWLSEEMKWG